MDHWNVAIVLFALVASGFLTGAGIYEQAVLDTAWPRKRSIVRPAEGGANRKLFWVPGNILAVVTLLLAACAAWPVAAACHATLVAIGLFLIINVVTVGYFAPAVFQVERHSVPPDEPSSWRWVRWSRWRTALAIGVNVALGFATVSLLGA